MRKNAVKSVKIFLLLFACLLILMTLLSFTLQTSWGKQKIHNYIQEIAKKAHAKIEIVNLSGALPFTWTIDQLNIEIEDKFNLSCKNVSFEISFFALIKQELSFKRLKIKECNLRSLESSKPKENAQEFVDYLQDLSLNLRVKPIHIEKLLVNEEVNPRTIRGKFYLAKQGKYVSLRWISKSTKTSDEYELVLRGSPERGFRSTFVFENLSIQSPLNLNLFGKIKAHGTWKAFLDLLAQCPSSEQIKGTFSTNLPLSSNVTRHEINLGPLEIHGSFIYQQKHFLNISSLKASNRLFSSNSSLNFDENFQLESGKIEGNIDSLSHIFPKVEGGGTLSCDLYQKKNVLQYDLNLAFKKIESSTFKLENYESKLKGEYKDQTLTGLLEGQFLVNELTHQISGNISYKPEEDFQIPFLLISSDNSQFESHLTIGSDLILEGNTLFSIRDLNSWLVVYPNSEVYGSVNGEIFWVKKDQQFVEIQTSVENFRYKSFWSHWADFWIELSEISNQPKGNITTLFQEATFWGVDLERLQVFTSNETENWPFEVQSDGVWKSPFSVNSRGFWKYAQNESLLNIQEFSGFFFNHSFDMPEPFQVISKHDSFDTQPLFITLENSRLQFQANVAKDESNIDCTLDHFPIDFLSLNPLEIDLSGYVSSRFHIEQNSQASGELDLSFEEVNLWAMDETLPFSFTGQVHAALENEKLDLFTHLQSNEVDIVKAQGALPIKVNLSSFQAELKKNDPLNLSLHFDGPIEEVLDFINIGPQRFEGDVICDVDIKNTFNNPKVNGICQLRNGFYENYFTGMVLENLSARFIADRDTIKLDRLIASDPMNGKLSANGTIDIAPKKHFPYRIDCKLSDLEIIRLDSLTTYAKGNLELTGNTKKGSVKGKVQVTDANFSIPGKITKDLPSIEVTYVPKVSAKSREPTFPASKYPLDLDLKLSAPSTITVSGRGVNSKWKGNVKLGGEFPEEILAKGRLDMVRGEFVFSGKFFSLSEGELVFDGKKTPFLSLTGSLTEQGIMITANLKGDLTKPKLTFRSSPPLPLSSILSYLIFGQDISEISGFQAIQLASAVASIAGEGPDYLEETRRSLGVDRLAIINQPTGDGESVAVQVGKYITKNVLVSVSQGAQQDSTNVTVEVDLKKGFIFQAETQQQQVQGKFTLKWNRNF